MRSDECPPRLFQNASIRDGLDAVGFENAFDRRCGNRDVQTRQGTNNFTIAPEIAGRNGDNQALGDIADRLSAAPLPWLGLNFGNGGLHEVLIPAP